MTLPNPTIRPALSLRARATFDHDPLTPEQKTHSAFVRKAVDGARRFARSGNIISARRLWRVAARQALNCGGMSGSVDASDGYSAIVLQDGFFAISPIPVNEVTR